MRINIKLIAAMIVGACVASAPAAAQAAGPPGIPSPALAGAKPDLDAIVKGLGSENSATRDAAQRALDALSRDSCAALVKLAQETPDAEVKARLTARVEDIQEQFAADPPRISLDLKNASLADVATALNKAMGFATDPVMAGMVVAGGGGIIGVEGNDQFTLNVKDHSFWEIIQNLSRQRPLIISSSISGMRLMQAEPGLRNMAISGGFAIYPSTLSWTKSVNPQDEPGREIGPPQLTMTFTITADPRIKILQTANPQFSQVLDDRGNNLITGPPQPAPVMVTSPRTNAWTRSIALAVPEKLGKKIVSAKGEAKFMVVSREQKVVLEEAAKRLNEQITLGTTVVTISQFDVTDANFALKLVGIRVSDPAAVRGTVTPATAVLIKVVDADGKIAWTSSIASGSMSTSNSVPFRRPLKIELSAPIKTALVTIPFELKDIPLP